MERWVGKVAVVTGASAGIGAAIVEELTKNGMKVIGLARRVEKIEEIKAKVSGGKGELHAYKCDVGIEKDVEKTFEWIKDKFGTIHVLVNNAGIIRNCSLRDGHLGDMKDILNVNVIAVINVTQKALRLMKEKNVNDGHIINIGSLAGHCVPDIAGMPLSVYSASKHALRALTEGVRQELRNLNLRTKITSISPGAVATEIATASARETKSVTTVVGTDDLVNLMTEISILQPKDIADALVYVLHTPPHVQVHELLIRPIMDKF